MRVSPLLTLYHTQRPAVCARPVAHALWRAGVPSGPATLGDACFVPPTSTTIRREFNRAKDCLRPPLTQLRRPRPRHVFTSVAERITAPPPIAHLDGVSPCSHHVQNGLIAGSSCSIVVASNAGTCRIARVR